MRGVKPDSHAHHRRHRRGTGAQATPRRHRLLLSRSHHELCAQLERRRQSRRALGAGAGRAARRGRRAADGEPSRICRDLARPAEGRRRRGADQHQSARRAARPFDRHRRAPGTRSSARNWPTTYLEAAPQIAPRPIGWCAGGAVPGMEDLDAALAAHAGDAPADPRLARRRHRARTRRSTSTPPARRACPRRRTSRICACFS